MLLIEKTGAVALVTLNRPDAMNALSRQLRAQLDQAMRALSDDDSVSVVVLTGAGRAFTAGLDLKELAGAPDAMSAANSTSPAENPALAILQCPKPVIGAINGVAITGGFEVALACDVLIASTQARFADTHARVGIMPGWGLSQKLSRIIGISRAKQLSFSGNFLDAETACAWGLVNSVVPANELLAHSKALARDIASVEPAMVQTYKRLIDDGYALTFGEAMAHEARVSTAANGRVNAEEVEARRMAIIERGRTQG